eukprot:ANDGO_06389.mRNA.1 Leucine-rich repeat-containing protein ODA7
MATITDELIKRLVKEQELFRTYELNDILYLHFKGLMRISNLDKWTGLKALWLEGNSITTIENLGHLQKLKCLYLHQNLIEEIGGLEELTELDQLNLSDNSISRIENLGHCSKLTSLYLANNKIQTVDDVRQVLEVPSLSCLDLSKNKIEDPAVVFEVLVHMPNLKVLKLDGNPVVRKVPSYRKSVIAAIKTLTYLDDRPVFDDERRCVSAWEAGGIEAERREKEFIKQEEIEKNKANMRAFDEMVERARASRPAVTESVEILHRPSPAALNDNDLRSSATAVDAHPGVRILYPSDRDVPVRASQGPVRIYEVPVTQDDVHADAGANAKNAAASLLASFGGDDDDGDMQLKVGEDEEMAGQTRDEVPPALETATGEIVSESSSSQPSAGSQLATADATASSTFLTQQDPVIAEDTLENGHLPVLRSPSPPPPPPAPAAAPHAAEQTVGEGDERPLQDEEDSAEGAHSSPPRFPFPKANYGSPSLWGTPTYKQLWQAAQMLPEEPEAADAADSGAADSPESRDAIAPSSVDVGELPSVAHADNQEIVPSYMEGLVLDDPQTPRDDSSDTLDKSMEHMD